MTLSIPPTMILTVPPEPPSPPDPARESRQADRDDRAVSAASAAAPTRKDVLGMTVLLVVRNAGWEGPGRVRTSGEGVRSGRRDRTRRDASAAAGPPAA